MQEEAGEVEEEEEVEVAVPLLLYKICGKKYFWNKRITGLALKSKFIFAGLFWND